MHKKGRCGWGFRITKVCVLQTSQRATQKHASAEDRNHQVSTSKESLTSCPEGNSINSTDPTTGFGTASPHQECRFPGWEKQGKEPISEEMSCFSPVTRNEHDPLFLLVPIRGEPSPALFILAGVLWRTSSPKASVGWVMPSVPCPGLLSKSRGGWVESL